MFYLPTGALQYVGHTLNSLTLYWHYSTDEIEYVLLSSTGLLSEMAHEGINKITAGTGQIIIPNTIVSHLILIIMLLKFTYSKQEMRLFEGAWDGDMECVRCVLETGVPVDITRPVRLYTKLTLRLWVYMYI